MIALANREETVTVRVDTQFGNLYAHVAARRVTEIRLSSPGKFSDTTMGQVLDALGEALTNTVQQIGA